jgi:hypothetical protein
MTKISKDNICRSLAHLVFVAASGASLGQSFEQRIKAVIEQHSPIALGSFKRSEHRRQDGSLRGVSFSAKNSAWYVEALGTIAAETIQMTMTQYSAPPQRPAVGNLRAVAISHADALVRTGTIPFNATTWNRMKLNAKMDGNKLTVNDKVAGIDSGIWGNMVELTINPSTGKVTQLQTRWNRTYLTEGATLPITQLQSVAQRSVNYRLKPGGYRWLPIGSQEKVKTLRRVFEAIADDGDPHAVKMVTLDAVTGKVIPQRR